MYGPTAPSVPAGMKYRFCCSQVNIASLLSALSTANSYGPTLSWTTSGLDLSGLCGEGGPAESFSPAEARPPAPRVPPLPHLS